MLRSYRAAAKPTPIGPTASRWTRIAMWPSSPTNARMARSAAHTGHLERRSSSRTTRSNGTKETLPDTASSSSDSAARSIATCRPAACEAAELTMTDRDSHHVVRHHAPYRASQTRVNALMLRIHSQRRWSLVPAFAGPTVYELIILMRAADDEAARIERRRREAHSRLPITVRRALRRSNGRSTTPAPDPSA